MSNGESKFEMGMRSIVGVLIGIGFLVLLFILLRGIFSILYWLAPILIIGALLVNYRTVVNYVRWLWNLLNRNVIMGLVAVLLSVLGYPVVFGYLFARSFLDRKVRQLNKGIEPSEQYAEYEDVTDEGLELKQLERRKDLRSDG